MSRKIIKRVLAYGLVGLSTDTKREILREHGRGNVQSVRNATQEDVDWVRGMGGYVPDGIVAKEQAR